MKKILISLLIFSTAFLSFGQKIIVLQSEQNGMTITSNTGLQFSATMGFNEFSIQQMNTPAGVFAQIEVPGFAYRYNDGNPSIPVFSNLIEMPGQVDVEITVKSFTTQTINLADYGIYDKIIPAQPSYSKSTNPEDIHFIFNESAYLINDFSQGSLISIEYEGMARGVGIGQLIIDPIRYNPVKNQLVIYNNIEFQVTFNTQNYAQYLEEKDRVYSPLFNSTYYKLPNYKEASTKDVISQYPIKYVIVSDPMFEDTLQSFINWKTQKGFHVVEAYTNDPSVGTTTTTIKAYLQGLYNAGTPTDPAPTFVLLVGDVAQIPAFAGTAGTHPSDMYYVEYTGGGDFIPEIYIGRFSATSVAQLIPQIQKTLQYEKFTMPESVYMDTVILVAGNDANFEMSHGNPHINYGTNNYFNSSNDIYAWTYLGPNNSDAQVGADMRAKLYKGFGFANYTAHCNSDRWGDPTFTTAQIPNMYNKDKYGLMIGNCCLSNKFNDAVCLGEGVLRAVDKGAIGYIGGSNNTYWDEDYWWGVGVTSTPVPSNPTFATTGRGAFDGLFHSHGEPFSDWFITNSQVFYCGNSAVQASTSTRKKYYWEIYHLMGDPSVMTYLWDPDPLVVSYNSPIMVGDQQLVVNCEDYTLVAISQDNVLLDSKFSGPNTSVTLEFPSFIDDGTALIVATRQNRAPYIQEIDIEDISVPVDAQVMYIQNVESHYSCVNMNIQPLIVLRNKGINNLTQVTLNYTWNGGTVNQISWTGNLATLDTTHIILPNYMVSAGNHELVVYTTNPNGTIDGNTDNDTLDVSFLAEDLPLSVDFATSITEFCLPPASVNFVNNSANAASYLWDFGDGNTSTQMNPTHTYATTGLFTVSLSADAGICGSDVLVLTDYILVGSAPPVASSVQNCGPTSFVLNATAPTDVYWYSDALCTNLFHTGYSYTTPVLNNSETYYLRTEIMNDYFGGRPDNSGTGGYYTSTGVHGLIFNCTAPVTLKSVKVYYGGTSAANRTIRLENSGGSLIESRTVSVPPGESRITLNMDIPVGNNLKLMGPASPNLFRNGATGMNIGYPLAAGNYISIIESTAGGAEPNYYYYFYDWEVEEQCISVVTEVNAYIHSTPTADFSYTVAGNTVDFTNLSTGGGGGTYLWTFGDGNTSTLENPVHTYTSTGTYTVTLEISNSCGNHSSNQQVNITTTIVEDENNSQIVIYPNPAQSSCYIESNSTIDLLQVFDLTGKLVYEELPGQNFTTIGVESFAKGVYMLKIVSENNVSTAKLLIK